jgi:hypothetical protein
LEQVSNSSTTTGTTSPGAKLSTLTTLKVTNALKKLQKSDWEVLSNSYKFKKQSRARNMRDKQVCPLKDQASMQHQRELKKAAAPSQKASATQAVKQDKHSQGYLN